MCRRQTSGRVRNCETGADAARSSALAHRDTGDMARLPSSLSPCKELHHHLISENPTNLLECHRQTNPKMTSFMPDLLSFLQLFSCAMPWPSLAFGPRRRQTRLRSFPYDLPRDPHHPLPGPPGPLAREPAARAARAIAGGPGQAASSCWPDQTSCSAFGSAPFALFREFTGPFPQPEDAFSP